MSDEVLDLTKEDGSTEQELVPAGAATLKLVNRQLVAVSDNVAQLTDAIEVLLERNAFTEFPAGVLAMTNLTSLSLGRNRLSAIPREIGRMRALTNVVLSHNQLAAVPREIGQLTALKFLSVDSNPLTTLPSELCQLRSLKMLLAQNCRITWLPLALGRLPALTMVFLNENPLLLDALGAGAPTNLRPRLAALFAATTAVAMIRDEAATLCVGLADLDLPALVTLEIVDAAFPNAIPMHKKWDLIAAVKHFHERRGT